MISRDSAIVTAYQTDPLVHDQLSVGAGLQFLEAANWLNAYTGKVAMPLLLQHGGDDQITSSPATREFAGRLDGDIEFKEWTGLYHEIHNEPELEDVFAFTLKWMQKQL